MSEQPTNPDEQAAAEQFDADAAMAAQRVVDGQVHDGNPEYPEQHPNAVTDKAKAEEMAYASKAAEEAVVKNGNQALETAPYVNITDQEHAINVAKRSKGDNPQSSPAGTLNLGTGGTPRELRQKYRDIRDTYIQKAEDARNLAEQQALDAGDTYDRVQALKNGKIPEVPQNPGAA